MYQPRKPASTAPNPKSRSAAKPVQKLVWRISPAHPAGAFVAADERSDHGRLPNHEPKLELSDEYGDERDFRNSSRVLASGIDVQETDFDTLPGDLMEAFTKPGK